MRFVRSCTTALALVTAACHDAVAPLARRVDAATEVQVAAARVSVLDLGFAPGHSNTFLKDVNNRGEAVGLSYDASLVTHLVHVPAGGTSVIAVLPLGQNIVGVGGINDAGEVGGTWNGSPFQNRPRGFKWKGGVVTDIVRGTQTVVNAINASGAVAGMTTNPGWSGSTADFSVPREIGFTWNGSYVDRGYPAVADFTVQTLAMNDYGDAVGKMVNFHTTGGPVLWKGTAASLPFGQTDFVSFSSINNSGLITGTAYDYGTGQFFSMTWDGVTPPQPLPGGSYAAATDVNNLGEVAGFMYDPTTGTTRATLWVNGRAIDLGTGPGVSAVTYGVNDLGWVVGATTFANGPSHAVMWKVSSPPADVFTSVRASILQAGSAGYITQAAVQQLLASLSTNSLPRFRAAVASLTASRALDTVSAQVYASLVQALARRL